MADQTQEEIAARAAFRLGIVETMLACHKDPETNLDLPGIFVEQLNGERNYRRLELRSSGVDPEVLSDLGFKK